MTRKIISSLLGLFITINVLLPVSRVRAEDSLPKVTFLYPVLERYYVRDSGYNEVRPQRLDGENLDEVADGTAKIVYGDVEVEYDGHANGGMISLSYYAENNLPHGLHELKVRYMPESSNYGKYSYNEVGTGYTIEIMNPYNRTGYGNQQYFRNVREMREKVMTADSTIPSKRTVGFNSHLAMNSHTDYDKHLERLVEGKVKIVREDIQFNLLMHDTEEQQKGWEHRHMKTFLNYANNDMYAIGMLSIPKSGRDAASLKEFGKKVGRLFGDDLLAFEMLNEPNGLSSLDPPTPQNYYNQVKPIVEGIREENRDVMIIVGALTFPDANWMAEFINIGGNLLGDTASVHMYYGRDVEQAKGNNKMMQEYNAWYAQVERGFGKGTKVYVSEFGISGGGGGGTGIDETIRIDYMKSHTERLLATNTVFNIAVYELRDSTWRKNEGPGKGYEANFGFLDDQYYPKAIWRDWYQNLPDEAVPEIKDIELESTYGKQKLDAESEKRLASDLFLYIESVIGNEKLYQLNQNQLDLMAAMYVYGDVPPGVLTFAVWNNGLKYILNSDKPYKDLKKTNDFKRLFPKESHIPDTDDMAKIRSMVLYYHQDRVKDLRQEQDAAVKLKQELEKMFGGPIPLDSKYWHYYFNGAFYGEFSVEAVYEEIKKGGGGVIHTNIKGPLWLENIKFYDQYGYGKNEVRYLGDLI